VRSSAYLGNRTIGDSEEAKGAVRQRGGTTGRSAPRLVLELRGWGVEAPGDAGVVREVRKRVPASNRLNSGHCGGCDSDLICPQH